MITPLIIGNKTFATNLIQAPLAGISCAPFRKLVWQFGGIAYCCTEMLSAYAIANDSDRSPRYQMRDSIEQQLCWQLSGNRPELLAKASYVATQKGADLIDLNAGCPQPKVRKKGCGSRLLQDEKKLVLLIQAIQQNTGVPVTVKMRIDAGVGDFCDVDRAKVIEESGADAIIVHGRHWTHDYSVPAQRETIARIVEAVSIPVIANGDVDDVVALKKWFDETQCAGVMIARASVGQPWLFQQLIAECQNKVVTLPSMVEVGELFLAHIKGLIALEGESQAIMQCRRFGKYYARSMPNKNDFLVGLYQATDFETVQRLMQDYFY